MNWEVKDLKASRKPMVVFEIDVLCLLTLEVYEDGGGIFEVVIEELYQIHLQYRCGDATHSLGCGWYRRIGGAMACVGRGEEPTCILLHDFHLPMGGWGYAPRCGGVV